MLKKFRNPSDGEEYTAYVDTTAPPVTADDDRERMLAHLRVNPCGPLDYANLGPTQIVALCGNLYQECFVSMMSSPYMEGPEAKRRAGDEWRAILPDITDRRTTLAYIACVAWGAKMGILTTLEVKTMMYLAQTQLSVLKTSGQLDPPPPNPTGNLFDQSTEPQHTMEPTRAQMKRGAK